MEKTYKVSYYVSLADKSNTASNNYDVAFTLTKVTNPSNCGVLKDGSAFITPQIRNTSILTDAVNWVKVEQSFVASAAFRYINIGNFYENSNTSTVATSGTKINTRIFLDDIVVEEEILLANSAFSLEAAAKNKEYTSLNWFLEDDAFVDNYLIERSSDGIAWEKIGQVNNEGNGNNEFNDYTVPNGVFYYRIGAQNFFNELEYSEIGAVERKLLYSANVYPNPTTDVLNISFETVEGTYDCLLWSQTGQQIALPTIQKKGRSCQLDLSSVPRGTYILQLKSAKLLVTKKIIVQ